MRKVITVVLALVIAFPFTFGCKKQEPKPKEKEEKLAGTSFIMFKRKEVAPGAYRNDYVNSSTDKVRLKIKVTPPNKTDKWITGIKISQNFPEEWCHLNVCLKPGYLHYNDSLELPGKYIVDIISARLKADETFDYRYGLYWQGEQFEEEYFRRDIYDFKEGDNEVNLTALPGSPLPLAKKKYKLIEDIFVDLVKRDEYIKQHTGLIATPMIGHMQLDGNNNYLIYDKDYPYDKIGPKGWKMKYYDLKKEEKNE